MGTWFKTNHFTCCICGKEFIGYGNNPYPVVEHPLGNRCCDKCNDEVVIPARLKKMQEKNV